MFIHEVRIRALAFARLGYPCRQVAAMLAEDYEDAPSFSTIARWMREHEITDAAHAVIELENNTKILELEGRVLDLALAGKIKLKPGQISLMKGVGAGVIQRRKQIELSQRQLAAESQRNDLLRRAMTEESAAIEAEYKELVPDRVGN